MARKRRHTRRRRRRRRRKGGQQGNNSGTRAILAKAPKIRERMAAALRHTRFTNVAQSPPPYKPNPTEDDPQYLMDQDAAAVGDFIITHGNNDERRGTGYRNDPNPGNKKKTGGKHRRRTRRRRHARRSRRKKRCTCRKCPKNCCPCCKCKRHHKRRR